MTQNTEQNGLPPRSGGDVSESWRLECEAREWLRRAGRDPVKIRERLASIANRRGQAANVKCRYRLTLPNGDKTPILEMPQEDYWAGHTAMLEAFGIRDKQPVPDETTARAIVRIALKRYQAIAVQDAGNGKRGGKTFKR